MYANNLPLISFLPQPQPTAGRPAGNNVWSTCKAGSTCEYEFKAALRRGSYGALNVYTTIQSDNTLGWATFPGRLGSVYSTDGVVVDYRTLPPPNGNSASASASNYPYNLGQTATHEVGHWFGLEHTFRGGCAVDVAAGDGIPDTPAQAYPVGGCPVDTTDTCPGSEGGLAGRDPVTNYMGYQDDRCMRLFTEDQGVRMRQLYTIYRTMT
jgi:hypothetical protein